MCGIYGIIDKTGKGIDRADMNIFAQMAILTQLRGMHNSGVYAVDKDNPKSAARVVKTVGHSHNLVYEKGWDNWLKFATEKAGAIIGHGRHATVGKITKANAHPFKSNHITLVHNGTIRGGLDDAHQEEVDSHNLTKQIAVDGFEEALKSIIGAYAIVAHDESSGKLMIAKNYERPLALLETHDRIYIMSHDKALEYLYSLNNQIGYGKVTSFASEKLYEYDFSSRKLGIVGDLGKVWTGGSYANFYDYSKSSPPTSQSKSAETKGCAYNVEEDIIFQVIKIIPPVQGSVYTYLCIDEDKNSIFFKTDSNNPQWLDQWAIGKCCMKTFQTDTGKWLYQIKTRSIDWDAYDVEDQTEVLVPLVDGDSIEKAKWQEMCEKDHCAFCSGPVYPEDNELSAVIEQTKGKLSPVCKHCVVHNKSLFGVGVTL